MHACPICNQPMRPNALLCLTHYSMVPVALQRQVILRGKQLLTALKGGNPRLMQQHSKLYRQACETAVAFVRGKVERAAACVQAVAK